MESHLRVRGEANKSAFAGMCPSWHRPQAAIDKAAGAGREGIVFVPIARYTLTRTIYLWPSVRLVGYGATRPVFV